MKLNLVLTSLCIEVFIFANFKIIWKCSFITVFGLSDILVTNSSKLSSQKELFKAVLRTHWQLSILFSTWNYRFYDNSLYLYLKKLLIKMRKMWKEAASLYLI